VVEGQLDEGEEVWVEREIQDVEIDPKESETTPNQKGSPSQEDQDGTSNHVRLEVAV